MQAKIIVEDMFYFIVLKVLSCF